MAFFDFCATFLFDYICSNTVAYLILLDLLKPSDLDEWLDKKNLNCDTVLYFYTGVLSKVRIWYLFVSIFQENNWLEKKCEREKDVNWLLEQLWFLKWRKQDDERNISPVLIVHLQKCQRMLKCVRRNGQ